MYQDYKLRRAFVKEMKDRGLNKERNVNPAALKWFRATPYQLEYQRKYGIKPQTSEHKQDNQEVTG